MPGHSIVQGASDCKWSKEVGVVPPTVVFCDVVCGVVGPLWVPGLELFCVLGLKLHCSAAVGLAVPWLGPGSTGVGYRGALIDWWWFPL